MGKPIAQNSSANVVIGPAIDASGSAVTGATIANNAIVIVKEASTSASRNATTSAASVGPALYRIVLNSTDTDTLGTLVIHVSVSGALPFRYEAEVWQSATHALFYGTTNQIATSAAVSAIVSGVLDSYNAASAGEVLTSSQVSVIAAQALSDYAALVSANLSAGVDAVFVQRGLHMLVDVSASVAGIHDNSIIGMTWASVSANAFDRTSDSLRAISQNLGGGAGLTSAQASTIMAGVLSDYDAATSADVSVIVSGVLASYNAASAGELLTSAQVSTIVAQGLSDYDGATSADVSVIVSGVLASYNVASAGELVTQAEVSAAVSTALTNYNVASAGDLLASNDVSAAVSNALTNYNVASVGDVLTSAQVSSIGAQVLSDYDVPTSADVSAIHVAVLQNTKVNIGQVNDVSVSGVGTTADPWRPA